MSGSRIFEGMAMFVVLLLSLSFHESGTRGRRRAAAIRRRASSGASR